MNLQEFRLLAEALKTKESRFASFKYTNQQGETSAYLVHLNINYGRVLQADLKKVKAFRPKDDFEKQAKAEILESIQDSIAGKNPRYTCEGVFEHIAPSVKVHVDTNRVYIDAYLVHRHVITPGVYKKVNHRPLTIAKKKVEQNLKKSRFRTFILDANSIHAAKLNGTTIELS